jgi:hypothetical protein
LPYIESGGIISNVVYKLPDRQFLLAVFRIKWGYGVSNNKMRFGKGYEYELIGQMVQSGLDCYMPIADDNGIDVVIRKSDGIFIDVQIKAINNKDAGLFTSIVIPKNTKNFYILFYDGGLNKRWILSKDELIKYGCQNSKGIDKGKFNIGLATKKNKDIFDGFSKRPLQFITQKDEI